MRAIEKLLASKRLLVNLSRDFTPVAMFQSFCLEDLVLADLIYSDLVHQEYTNIEMFTVDTGRLPVAILQSMENMRERYGNILKVYYPNTIELEQLDAHHGLRRSEANQYDIIRLQKPLRRALSGKKAWITASDIFQETQTNPPRIYWDKMHQLARVNPIARWTNDEIASYASHHGLTTADYATAKHHHNQRLVNGHDWREFSDRNHWISTQNIA